MTLAHNVTHYGPDELPLIHSAMANPPEPRTTGPKNLEFGLTPKDFTEFVEMADGACYDLKFDVAISCQMDGQAITGLNPLEKHWIYGAELKIGKTSIDGITKTKAYELFAEAWEQNQRLFLAMCRKANGEQS